MDRLPEPPPLPDHRYGIRAADTTPAPRQRPKIRPAVPVPPPPPRTTSLYLGTREGQGRTPSRLLFGPAGAMEVTAPYRVPDAAIARLPTVALPVVGRRPAAGDRPASRTPDGAAAVILAAVLWATVGPVAALLPPHTDPIAVGGARMLLGGALFALLWARGAALRRLFAVRGGTALVVVGIIGMAVYQGCYFSALHLTGVAVGSVVTATSTPVFAGVITALLGRGRPSPRWYVGTALAVTANAAIVLGAGWDTVHTVGVACGLAGGAAYATFANACAIAVGKGAPSETVMAVCLLGAGLAMSPVLLRGGVAWLAAPHAALVVLYLAAVGTVGAYLLFGRGLERTSPATATSMALVEPAVAAVLGVLLLREIPSAYAGVGMVVMAAALAVFTLRRSRHSAPTWGLTWTILPAGRVEPVPATGDRG